MDTMYSSVLKDAKFSQLDVGGGGFNFRGGGRGGGDGGGGGGGGDDDDKPDGGPLLSLLLAAPFILHLLACLVLFVRFVPGMGNATPTPDTEKTPSRLEHAWQVTLQVWGVLVAYLSMAIAATAGTVLFVALIRQVRSEACTHLTLFSNLLGPFESNRE